MGRLVRLVGSGIGLAAEAIKSRRSVSPSAEATSSRSPIPPAAQGVVEVPEERAEELIRTGQAVPADSKEKAKVSEIESDSDDSSTDEDEACWELDDAAREYTEGTKQQDDSKDVNDIVQSFVAEHPPPSYAQATGSLPCPVIIPQRRPRAKGRGFVRAYAPVLNDCGIDQNTFLSFLKSFHMASKVRRHSSKPE